MTLSFLPIGKDGCKMKYSCDMIKDLLSLYCDNVCSEDSRAVVEEHLNECEPCRAELQKLRDNTYTDGLKDEQSRIITAYKKETRKKALYVLLTIFAIPIMVCFTVNIAVGHTLDWFFIVLTSLTVLGSFVLVPLIAEKRKFLWIVTSFTASLLLLLFTCNIYSGGGGWFIIAAIAVLFGLSVVFLPFAVRQIPLKGFWSRHKGLLVMLTDTVLLCLLIAVSVGDNYLMAYSITGYCLILPWVMFLVIRYLKINGLIKAGICSIVTGAFLSSADCVTDFLINGKVMYTKGFWEADLTVWDNDLSANIMLIILLSGVSVGVVLIALGMIFRNKLKFNKEKREGKY